MSGLWMLLSAADISQGYVIQKTAHWKHTQATMLTAELRWERRTRAPLIYCADVTYQYTVDFRGFSNQTFESDTISLPNYCFRSEGDAQRFLKLYKPGDKVNAFYNPKNP